MMLTWLHKTIAETMKKRTGNSIQVPVGQSKMAARKQKFKFPCIQTSQSKNKIS